MNFRNKKSEKNNFNNISTIILIIYIYMPFIMNILENTFFVPSIINYIIQTILIVFIIIFGKLNKKTLIFLSLFLLAIGINCIAVDYRYYVLVEGIQAFLGVAIPCLIISQSQFDLGCFLRGWYKFAKIDLLLVIISIVFLKKGFVHYSIFTNICVPNVFIIATMFLLGKEENKKDILIAAFNILSTIILGGRMAGIVSLCMIVIAIAFSTKLSFKKKILIFSFAVAIVVVILINFGELLLWINENLNNVGMHSRSLTLLIEQIEKNKVHVSGRDEIYTKCIEFIKMRYGLPGGFGVPQYLTNGEYYYSHNLILQLLITFGGIGTLLLMILLYQKMCMIKKYESKDFFRLIIFSFFSYILIGMTGSSIWINYISTIAIALVFFRNHKLYKEKRENEEDIKKI